MTDRELLAILVRLHAAMTPGEWKENGTDVDAPEPSDPRERCRVAKCWSSTFAPPREEARINACAITELRNLLPDLIAALARKAPLQDSAAPC